MTLEERWRCAARARDMLDTALGIARELGMTPLSEQAERLLDTLAVATPARRLLICRPSSFPDRLTAREVEVLQLLATGLTNKEIAAELVVSPGTVHRHLVNIYTKIGTRRRVDAATYALNHGLAAPPA